MPTQLKYGKKVFIMKKKYKKKRKKASLPLQLKMKTYRFKRDIEQTMSLSGSSAPEGWAFDGTSRIYKNFGWSLGSLGNHAEFTNLFKQYRLKGARIKFFFSNTVSGTEDGSSHANSQLIVRMAPNQTGTNALLNDAYWSQLQAKKYKTAINGGRPLDVYMPLRQPNEMQTSTGTAPAVQYPQWVLSSITNLVHYGMSISIERADGQTFTSGYGNTQYVKLITTLYLETRGVM